MFTDNDELSGMIASMMDMQALIILSNICLLYTSHLSAVVIATESVGFGTILRIKDFTDQFLGTVIGIFGTSLTLSLIHI